MKSLELKATHQNLLDTLVSDTIGRNKDICLFADIINSISDLCSIALDGSWGSGKTFFVKQTKMLLDAHNEFVKSMSEDDSETIKTVCKFKQIDFEPQVSVYYDAWENDNDSEPILSLIYSIINSVVTDFTFSNNTSCLQKAAAILEFFTDKNWNNVIESFKGNSPFEEIKKGKDIEKEIKEFLDSLLAERGNRLVIFIDELDRCKPSYAVKLLERIKHYFDNDRITFVFSINSLELQHTIKKHYGENFDACKYLDRFFDLRVSIPQPDMSKFYRSIDFDSSKYTFDIICDAIIKKYNFSLRETAKFIRLTKMAAYEPTHDNKKFDFSFSNGKARLFCLMYIIPLMIGLNIYDRDTYEEFISGRNPKPLIDLLIDNDVYWFNGLLSRSETFDDKDTDKTLVKFEDKLITVYKALFATSYTNQNSSVTVGEYNFESRTKSVLIQTVSLLSQYTSLYNETEEE